MASRLKREVWRTTMTAVVPSGRSAASNSSLNTVRCVSLPEAPGTMSCWSMAASWRAANSSAERRCAVSVSSFSACSAVLTRRARAADPIGRRPPRRAGLKESLTGGETIFIRQRSTRSRAPATSSSSVLASIIPKPTSTARCFGISADSSRRPRRPNPRNAAELGKLGLAGCSAHVINGALHELRAAQTRAGPAGPQ